MTAKTDLLNGTSGATTSVTTSGWAKIQPVSRSPATYSNNPTTDWLNSVTSRIINATANGAKRQLTCVADRTPIPVIYGEDRVGALVLNVVPYTFGGRPSAIVQCLWGYACDSMPNEPTYNDVALPTTGSNHVFYTGYTSHSVWSTFATAFQDVSGSAYTDTLAGFAVSYIIIPVKEFFGSLRFEAVLKGRRVYDPRTGTTVWSDNPALCAADFLASSTYGCKKTVDYTSVGASADYTTLTHAANACDELVSGEKRRTLNVVLDGMQAAPAVAETLRAYAGCFYLPGASGIKLVPDRATSSSFDYVHSSGHIAAISVSKKDLGSVPTEVGVTYTNRTVTPWKDDTVFYSAAGVDSTIPRRMTTVNMPGISRYSQAKREAIERLKKLSTSSLSVTLDVFDQGIAHEQGDVITADHPVTGSVMLLRIGEIEALPNGVWRLSCSDYDSAYYSNDKTTGPTYLQTGFMDATSPTGPISAIDYGATGDGSTPDTTALQAALTDISDAGGGILYIPTGTYIITESLLVGSNTTIRGDGNATVIKASQSAFTGTQANNKCYLFRNLNHTVSALTDSDIVIESLATDYGAVSVSGGGAHAISMRYVGRVTVRDCQFNNGENGTAFLACQDTLVENCVATETSNCGFDHWDGAGTARVIACTVRNTGGDNAQGIQFTATGSSGENRTSADCVAAFNTIVGVRNTTSYSASGIISNANDADSAVYQFRSIGNLIQDCDIGVAFTGEGGQHLSMGDTLIQVDQLPIFLQNDNSDNPDNCRVLYPHLIDCDHAAGNVALVSISGTGHSVRGLKVTNSGAAPYALIAWLTSNATNCLLDIESAPDGTGGRIDDDGTGSLIIDEFNRYYQSTWLPALTFGGGNTGLTYNSRAGRYRRFGKLCFISGYVNVSSNGSSTGAAEISLPFTAATTEAPGTILVNAYAGMSGLTAPSLRIDSAGTKMVLQSNGAAANANATDTSWPDGGYVYWSGVYETA